MAATHSDPASHAHGHGHDHAHAHGDHGHGHTPGAMDISAQKAMWDGFMRASAFGSLLILTIVGYLTLVFAIGMNWLVALAIAAVGGFAVGAVMGMGAAWLGTLAGLVVLAFISRALVTLFGALT